MSGARLALLLSFSHQAAEGLFRDLAAHLGVECGSEIMIDFTLQGGALTIGSLNGQVPESEADLAKCAFITIQRGFIPLTFAFNSRMYHQGALIVGRELELMEPYGRFEKKLSGVRYDYYLPLKKLFSPCGPVRQSKFDAQTQILRANEKLYREYLAEFMQKVRDLEKKDERTVRRLQHFLQNIDTDSESSKLCYSVYTMEFFENSKYADTFFDLYAKYSPYSCVALTALYIYEGRPFNIRSNEELWQKLERMVRLVSPRLNS